MITPEQRRLIRKNLRIEKFKKGKSLTKEEGCNILKAHLNITLAPKNKENWESRDKTDKIGDILLKMPFNEPKTGQG